MSGHLKNKKCYLSGPIQFAQGPNWRIEPISVMTTRFGIDVFDPYSDEKQSWTSELKIAKENKDISTMVKLAKGIVRKDLGMVDRSDFLIAYVPHGIKTIGTVHEVVNSRNSKKPTLLVTDQNDITCLPLWYFGFIPPSCMFANWDDLYNYLEEVDQGKHDKNDRWKFVYNLV